MNATLSMRQLRVVGLLVLAVVAVGGYLVTARHKPASTTSASSTPAVTTPAKTTPAPSGAHSQTATPAKLNTHGLPVSVARALRKRSVVVVSLVSPRSSVDPTAAAEARAAAAEVGAGYVAVDVFSQRPGTAILRKLGLVSTPLTLVIKRPANIVSQFTGLVDRDVVAQAIVDAR
jgi:hypothetical protein